MQNHCWIDIYHPRLSSWPIKNKVLEVSNWLGVVAFL